VWTGMEWNREGMRNGVETGDMEWNGIERGCGVETGDMEWNGKREGHTLTWRVPCTHDDPPIIGVCLDGVNHLGQLIHTFPTVGRVHVQLHRSKVGSEEYTS